MSTGTAQKASFPTVAPCCLPASATFGASGKPFLSVHLARSRGRSTDLRFREAQLTGAVLPVSSPDSPGPSRCLSVRLVVVSAEQKREGIESGLREHSGFKHRHKVQSPRSQ